MIGAHGMGMIPAMTFSAADHPSGVGSLADALTLCWPHAGHITHALYVVLQQPYECDLLHGAWNPSSS
jgi:hypothetical protein